MLVNRAQANLHNSTLLSLCSSSNPNPSPSYVLIAVPFHSATKPLSLCNRSHGVAAPKLDGRFRRRRAVCASGTVVEQLDSEAPSSSQPEGGDSVGFPDSEAFDSEEYFAASADLKHLASTPELDVMDLDELPEQWRRSKMAWLCKELPAQKSGTMLRMLNAQKKWLRQEEATYLAVHFMRIRENETGFRVYKWMMEQHWYRFDFGLATKLADYMGKERKFLKCREIFDDIITQGRVPCESTFHILIVAYLSVTAEGCLEEACSVYNRMIQLGGYQPRLSLHNSLFKAIVSKPGVTSKPYLKQAEFVYHNLVTTGLAIHKEIYAGLIWLHSYQDTVDKERITVLRNEMQREGIQETKDVLVSVLRASSKDGDFEEAEKTWSELVRLDGNLPSSAFVYRMEIFAKIRDPGKSVAIFEEMKEHLGSVNVVAHHKIIEILCQAQEVELAESAMSQFVNTGLKPVMPAYIDMMNMYFNLGMNDKVEICYTQCLENRQPTRTVYSIYMDSLVKTGNLEKAEEIFTEMQNNAAIGISSRSCNIILGGYLSSEDYAKAEKLYRMMCQKKYEVESSLMEKMDIVLSLNRKAPKKPINPKLSQEQRETLVGLLLGGLKIESDEKRKNHLIHFDFNDKPNLNPVFKRHIYDLYHEWLHPSCQASDDAMEARRRFFTVSHSYFGFYADQFWPEGKPAIPKLIHRWLSPRALAYWFMFGGHRTFSGDVLLKLRGNRDGVEKILKSLKTMSLDFRVKKKGRLYWIGFLGENSSGLWRVVGPFVLDGLKDSLKPGSEKSGDESERFDFDADERASDGSDSEGL